MIGWWEFTVSSALLVKLHPKRDVIKMEEAIIPFGMDYIKQAKQSSQSIECWAKNPSVYCDCHHLIDIILLLCAFIFLSLKRH